MHKKSCRRRRVVGCCFSVIMPLLTPRGGTRVAPEGAAPASTVDTPQPNTSFSEGTAMSALALVDIHYRSVLRRGTCVWRRYRRLARR